MNSDNNIKKCLESNFLVEGVDYNLLLEEQVRENRGNVSNIDTFF